MIHWLNIPVYLHVEPVDFRKSINGLSVLVEESMGRSPFEESVFVFCNRQRDKLKTLYWIRQALPCGTNAWRRINLSGLVELTAVH